MMISDLISDHCSSPLCRTYISKGASGEASVVGETVVTPIAFVRDDATVLDPLHHLLDGAH